VSADVRDGAPEKVVRTTSRSHENGADFKESNGEALFGAATLGGISGTKEWP
jgi:hypothetical protein